jgi:hypothetical protein
MFLPIAVSEVEPAWGMIMAILELPFTQQTLSAAAGHDPSQENEGSYIDESLVATNCADHRRSFDAGQIDKRLREFRPDDYADKSIRQRLVLAA